ncbi:GNAT family N-acetyltransferase [Bacillus sp. 2205SS5-2]|uniref:GNAT family N-acetyltransferase n=1 Tax=Bacillus sp. 2205SS5-2 TaxID=3109031 RepID=UPI0030072D75
MKIVQQCNQQDREFIKKKVIEHNLKSLSDEVKTALEDVSFVLRDADEKLIGGVTATLFWHHLHIDFLWVSEEYRNKGLGQSLMLELENFAIKRKCRLMLVDTFSFQAPKFYKDLGFKVIGVVEDHPKGHEQYFLEKRLPLPSAPE